MHPVIKTVKQGTKDGVKVKKYLQIVQSKRVNGKPTHEVLASLGRLPEDEAMGLKIAQAIIRHYRKERGDEQEEGVGLEESRSYGAVAVIRQVWKQLGLDRVVETTAAQVPKQR